LQLLVVVVEEGIVVYPTDWTMDSPQSPVLKAGNPRPPTNLVKDYRRFASMR
jgi:hypothetical protein